MKHILITLTLISLISSPLLAFSYTQLEDRVYYGVTCNVFVIEANWIVTSYIDTTGNVLYCKAENPNGVVSRLVNKTIGD